MAEIVNIPVNMIYPHPDNPRKDLGDLSELVESIKINGIMQNLTVVQNGDRYRVLIGHRRLAAAKLAGLAEVPCVITEKTPQEQIGIMLVENMQRTDLTTYEQAQGFQMMLNMGESVESISEKVGFSQSTVRRRVKLLDLDEEKFRKAEARGGTLFDYAELDKIESPELKNEVLDSIGTANFRDALKRAIAKEKHAHRMAEWEKQAKTFATEIKERDRVGKSFVPMDFVRNYDRWDADNVEVKKPDDADDVKYYYIVHSDQIDLYRKHQEHVETEEDRQRKEKQAAYDRKENELAEITERHFSIRYEFICDFSAAKKNILPICSFAAKRLFDKCASSYYNRPFDQEILIELLDLDVDEDSEDDAVWDALNAKLSKETEYAFLALAYAISDSDDNGYWGREWNYDKHCWELQHKENDELDQLYKLLVSLGYEMSDEEKAMQNGTHELLRQEEEQT